MPSRRPGFAGCASRPSIATGPAGGADGAGGWPGEAAYQPRFTSSQSPPPAGATRVGLTRENLGDNKGRLGAIEVEPSAPITRAELDARLGAGNALPRVDYNRPFVISYRVERPGAGFRCTVLASFADEPGATTPATKIALRRDVVKR